MCIHSWHYIYNYTMIASSSLEMLSSSLIVWIMHINRYLVGVHQRGGNNLNLTNCDTKMLSTTHVVTC